MEGDALGGSDQAYKRFNKQPFGLAFVDLTQVMAKALR